MPQHSKIRKSSKKRRQGKERWKIWGFEFAVEPEWSWYSWMRSTLVGQRGSGSHREAAVEEGPKIDKWLLEKWSGPHSDELRGSLSALKINSSCNFSVFPNAPFFFAHFPPSKIHILFYSMGRMRKGGGGGESVGTRPVKQEVSA